MSKNRVFDPFSNIIDLTQVPLEFAIKKLTKGWTLLRIQTLRHWHNQAPKNKYEHLLLSKPIDQQML